MTLHNIAVLNLKFYFTPSVCVYVCVCVCVCVCEVASVVSDALRPYGL